MIDIEGIRFLGDLFGWHEIECTNPSLISFKRAYRVLENVAGKSYLYYTKARIDIYPHTGTVGTALKHPKKGKTQLFRRHVKLGQLMMIFDNPRIHTGKGYYRRADRGYDRS